MRFCDIIVKDRTLHFQYLGNYQIKVAEKSFPEEGKLHFKSCGVTSFKQMFDVVFNAKDCGYLPEILTSIATSIFCARPII